MNIIITGASRGIGWETAKQFASMKGHKVFVISRNESKLEQLKSECAAINDDSLLIPIVFDLRSDNLEEELLPRIINEVKHVDILINNAGFLVNKPFLELKIEEVEEIFSTNVFAVFKLIQVLLPYMGQQSKTTIVNIGSLGGCQGSQKFPGLSAYSASKGALSILSECLAEEFKDININVNCLALEGVNTEMLRQAFPGYEAPVNADQMAGYIVNFCLGEGMESSGKVIVPDI